MSHASHDDSPLTRLEAPHVKIQKKEGEKKDEVGEYFAEPKKRKVWTLTRFLKKKQEICQRGGGL